jgi:hypothetical protein
MFFLSLPLPYHHGKPSFLFCLLSEPPMHGQGDSLSHVPSPTSVMFTLAEGRSGSDPHHGSSTSSIRTSMLVELDGRSISKQSRPILLTH